MAGGSLLGLGLGLPRPRATGQARGRQDRRLQDLAGRVVAAQGPLRQEDRQPRLPQDRPRAVRHRGRRVRQPVLQGQGPRLGLPEGPEGPGRRPRRDLRPDHDRRRGRPERHGQGRARTRPSRTTRSGSTPPRPWAATRSGSTPASTTARPTSAPSPRPARRSPSTARSTRSTSSARTTAGRRATPTPCSP